MAIAPCEHRRLFRYIDRDEGDAQLPTRIDRSVEAGYGDDTLPDTCPLEVRELPDGSGYGVFATRDIGRLEDSGDFFCSLEPIARYTSVLTSPGEYCSDPKNDYSALKMPQPFVHIIRGSPPVVLDAREAGNDMRFIRRSCHANVEIESTVICGEHIFVVAPVFYLHAGSEIFFDWWMDDTHPLQYVEQDPRSATYKTIPDEALVALKVCADAMNRSAFPDCPCDPDSWKCPLRHMHVTARFMTPYPLCRTGLNESVYQLGSFSALAPQLDGYDIFQNVERLSTDRSRLQIYPPPYAFFASIPAEESAYVLRRARSDSTLGLYVARSFSPGEPIAPYYSNVGLAADYIADPGNRYADLNMPLPFVRFVDGTALVLDARAAGSDARFIRTSCKANSTIVPALVGGTYTFVVVATKRISVSEYGWDEVRLPYQWGVAHPVSKLIAFASAELASEAPAQDHLSAILKMELKLHHEAMSAAFDPCACLTPCRRYSDHRCTRLLVERCSASGHYMHDISRQIQAEVHALECSALCDDSWLPPRFRKNTIARLFKERLNRSTQAGKS